MDTIVVSVGFDFIQKGKPFDDLLRLIENTPENKLRFMGTFCTIIGFLIIWYIKH